MSQQIPKAAKNTKSFLRTLWEPFSRTGTKGKAVRLSQLKITLCISSHSTSCLSALVASWSLFYNELALGCRAFYHGVPTAKFLPLTGSQMAIFIHCCIFVNCARPKLLLLEASFHIAGLDNPLRKLRAACMYFDSKYVHVVSPQWYHSAL